MAKTNIARASAPKTRTFEGAVALRENPVGSLKRVLFAHLLWEDSFYVNGAEAAGVLKSAVRDAVRDNPEAAQATILDARNVFNIRHASLMAAVTYAKLGGPNSRELIRDVISRADELAEVLAMAGGKKAPHSVMKGVRDAFEKFQEYHFGKYKGAKSSFSLRDAVFLTHPDPEKVPLVQKIVDGTLAVPDTWETRLSSGEDKKEAFTALLSENKLGAMALLRNLRNMTEARVDRSLISAAMAKADWSKVLPFRFMSAAQTAPEFSAELDAAFKLAVMGSDPLPGSTAVLLDTSGSMSAPISKLSTISSCKAGACIAAAVRGDHVRLFQWADHTKEMPNWKSLSSAMAVRPGEVGHGTLFDQAIRYAQNTGNFDRIIVVSDMQFADNRVPGLLPGQKGYTVNISSYGKAGLVAGDWTHLTGFSSAILKYISLLEMDRS